MAEPKLDVPDLLRQWERVVTVGKDAPGGGELYAFTARVINALPELARVYQQHDDAMRAAFFVSSRGYAVQVQMLDGAQQNTDDIARAYIEMARHFGWKPPRECD